MNELSINKIRIFIQKNLYIIYMNTLITHIKTKEEKYMSYLENLETVARKDLLLSNDTISYLNEVYTVCDDYILRHYGFNTRDYFTDFISNYNREIGFLLEIKTKCLPLYDHALREKILDGTDIRGLYKFARDSKRWDYMTSEEHDRYIKFECPDIDTKTIIKNFASQHPYQSILNTVNTCSYTEIMQVFLSFLNDRDYAYLMAIDVLSGGQFTKTVEDVYKYLTNIHDLFRYLKVYRVSKDSMTKIKTKIYPLCDAYRDEIVDKVVHILAVIGRHSDTDAIPENITEDELMHYVSLLKLLKNRTPDEDHIYDIDTDYYGLYTDSVFYIRTGTIAPTFEDVNDRLRMKFKRVLSLVCKEIRKCDLKIYKSIYELMFDLADTSINNCSNLHGEKYYTIDDKKCDDLFSLERFDQPNFKLHVHYVPISKDETRNKSVVKRMNEYRDRRAFNPLTPNFVEGFADIPSNYIPMDMKEIYVDGVEYKFTNDDIVDRDITPVGFSYSKTRSVRSNDFEATSGMQSISYYPKDEFGEPDRSTWEPRRNNWNQ